MVTIYELLEVSEDASKEEITNAYQKLILEFRQDPNFDLEINKENEMILNKIKIAYEILMDDNKRKRYDEDLAQKRAENLIKNVTIVEENIEQNAENKSKDNITNVEKTNSDLKQNSVNKNVQPLKNEGTENNYENIETKSDRNVNLNKIHDIHNQKVLNKQEQNNQEIRTNEQEILSEQYKKEIRKAAKKEFKQNLKMAKKAEQEYNEAYNAEYRKYLRNLGYQVEEPWTIKRIIRLILTIMTIIVIFLILWHIPPIRNVLNDLYNNNFIVKALVDLVKVIFETIIGFFK